MCILMDFPCNDIMTEDNWSQVRSLNMAFIRARRTSRCCRHAEDENVQKRVELDTAYATGSNLIGGMALGAAARNNWFSSPGAKTQRRRRIDYRLRRAAVRHAEALPPARDEALRPVGILLEPEHDVGDGHRRRHLSAVPHAAPEGSHGRKKKSKILEAKFYTLVTANRLLADALLLLDLHVPNRPPWSALRKGPICP